MQNKGIILVLTTAIISGVSIFMNQFGVKVVDAYIFAGLKNITVGLLLVGFILLLKEFKNIKKLTKYNWLILASIGLIGGSVPFLMFFKGLSLSTGPEASYIHKYLFVFILLLAPVLLKEKIKWHYFIGFVFLILGSVLLFQVNGNFQLNTGNMFILGATVLWAIENIISKKAVASISPRIVAWGRMSFGSLFIVLYWVITGSLGSLATLEFGQIRWVILTAILLFGYVTTWYTGLKYMPVSYAAAILALGAPITSLLELLQGKAFAPSQVWGMSFMFVGVITFIILDKVLCSRSKQLVSTQ